MSTSMTAVASGGGSMMSDARGTPTSTGGSTLMPNASTSLVLFREIHKNTWLKRLTADGKKITVGPKKSERSWVVFCVHDDSQALLEGYAEPRQASTHNPEWVVSMQETQHISHALIPNSHEFEFVVTLHNEVVRFHAMSWEVMQEWVETLRSKLREMKILSPRENLYTKLPEIRAPLLPTRDPTSPLPAPPPVPAALVPGVERVVPHGIPRSADATTNIVPITVTARETEIITTTSSTTSSSTNVAVTNSVLNTHPVLTSHTPAISSMSNTLTQNLLNLLSDPIIAYSEQLLEADLAEETLLSDVESNIDVPVTSNKVCRSHFLHQMPSVTESNITSLDISDNATQIPCQNENLNDLIICENIIPRPQASRSLSAGAADSARRPLATTLPLQHLNTSVKPDTKTQNVTELEISSALDESATVSTTDVITSASTSATTVSTTNITIIQVTNNRDKQPHQSTNIFNHKDIQKAADIFTFSEDAESTTRILHNKKHDDVYKSNVQIIPSSLNSSTIQVMNGPTFPTSNQYATPIKKNITQTNTDSTALSTSVAILSPRSHLENHQITTLHVGNTATTSAASVYGTCYTKPEAQQQGLPSTQALPNKIILSTNTLGVTNISVNSVKDSNNCDSVVLKSSAIDNVVRQNLGSPRYERVFLYSRIPVASVHEPSETIARASNVTHSSGLPMSPKYTSPIPQLETTSSNKSDKFNSLAATSLSLPSSPTPTAAFSAITIKKRKSGQQNSCSILQQQQRSVPQTIAAAIQSEESPASQRETPTVRHAPQVPARSRLLTRGLTEAVITSRPSRKDFSSPKALVKPRQECDETVSMNNNEEAETSAGYELRQSQVEAAQVSSTRSNSLEHRKRSSSTSETQNHRIRTANNNELISNRVGANAIRMDHPPHPGSQPALTAVKRLTLREQQVMQLRREILHPGGVRLQLRRKDCIGSIAWVEAFGAVWVAGWKQKEHPVLYNALHIGDQLISIAGVSTISAAADANKVIRNTNTLFIEVLIRRIPLGRGYAIRRERDGQCLGLIRDGNTSTIVDVVPNSLAARHGLTPKAQSCDGSTLTFWVLTEINGRPLNLFFKDNEIRDRLNSVGRDISILVQPSDLIAKLKKQLKSLRGYKDYLVQ